MPSNTESLTDEAVLKELHKDIAGNMHSPKVLMEAITTIERSALTLDFQQTGGDRARRANNGQNTQCHMCQQAGHTKEQCTVPKDKLSCKHSKKKGVDNTNSYCKRQIEKAAKKNKSEKRMKDHAPKMDQRRTPQRNPQKEIPHHAEMMRKMISGIAEIAHISSTQEERMKKS